MSEDGRPDGPASLEARVALAQAGDAAALEAVVVTIRDDIYNLAVRFLWHPQDAEDATQEILIRIITRLGSFRGESAFRTWVYRVTCNALLTIRKSRAEREALSLDAFAEDLGRGLSDSPLAVAPDVEEHLLMEEVRIGCTTAMLLCLDRAHRIAYVLGEIVQLDHNEAAAVLEISKANFRQRLSRARRDITALMQRRCGLFDPSNSCRCRKRVDTAVKLGRVDPERLLFAKDVQHARRFPVVLEEIRRLEALARAAALHRARPRETAPNDIVPWLRDMIRRGDPQLGQWAGAG